MENLDRYTCRYIKLHTYVVLPNLSKYINREHGIFLDFKVWMYCEVYTFWGI